MIDGRDTVGYRHDLPHYEKEKKSLPSLFFFFFCLHLPLMNDTIDMNNNVGLFPILHFTLSFPLLCSWG